MKLQICNVSVAPIRRGASDKSEIVTQLLFGDVVEILEAKSQWRKVRCTWDNYIGWTDFKLLQPITTKEYAEILRHPCYSLELAQAIMGEDHFIPILLGSLLPVYDGLRLQIAHDTYSFSGAAINPSHQRPTNELLLKIARKYLNAPYLWGGRSPFGIDCSGFTQVVYRMLGIALPRDAYQQVAVGETIDFVEQAQAGDLAFFKNKAGRIAHVGIIMPESKIIHAHGKVRIDKLDHYGIFNEAHQKYTHYLRIIKRVLPESAFQATSTQMDMSQPKASNQISLL